MVEIGVEAFCGCRLTSVTLPKSLRIVGLSAFTGVKKINVPDGWNFFTVEGYWMGSGGEKFDGSWPTNFTKNYKYQDVFWIDDFLLNDYPKLKAILNTPITSIANVPEKEWTPYFEVRELEEGQRTDDRFGRAGKIIFPPTPSSIQPALHTRRLPFGKRTFPFQSKPS